MKPQVHHIAIVVPEIEAALGLWRDLLGLPLAAQEHVPGQQSTVAFLEAGECQIELVRPDAADTGVARFLAARGPGLHHIALQVSGLDALLARLRSASACSRAACICAATPAYFLRPTVRRATIARSAAPMATL